MTTWLYTTTHWCQCCKQMGARGATTGIQHCFRRYLVTTCLCCVNLMRCLSPPGMQLFCKQQSTGLCVQVAEASLRANDLAELNQKLVAQLQQQQGQLQQVSISHSHLWLHHLCRGVGSIRPAVCYKQRIVGFWLLMCLNTRDCCMLAALEPCSLSTGCG